MTLTRLPDNTPQLLRDAGLTVVEVKGWKTRERPASTGHLGAAGVLWHHTGTSTQGWLLSRVLTYVWNVLVNGRSDLAGPLCQLSIGPTGIVYVVAAGRANHAGKARPSGPMAGGDGNTIYVGVEVQNSGTEGYPKPQYEAMVTTGHVLSSKIVHCSSEANRAHKETSETGKWDPGALSMPRFREDIHAAMNARKAPKMNNVQTAQVKLAQAEALIHAAVLDLEKAPDSRTAVHHGADQIKADAKALSEHIDNLPVS
jgi:hypothetical protein